MKKIKYLLFFGFFSVISILGFAYNKASDSELALFIETNDVIRELSYEDSLLDLAVLKFRLNSSENYDQINVAEENLREKLAMLKLLSSRLGFVDAAQSGLLEEAEKSINYKIDLSERIKFHNSVLRNSERYIPDLLNKYKGTSSPDMTINFYDLMLRSSLLNEETTFNDEKSILQGLFEGRKTNDGSDEINFGAKVHGIKVIETRKKLSGMLKDFLNIPSQEKISKLSLALSNSMSKKEAQKENIRQLMYVSGLFFLIAAVFSFFRFIGLNNKIKSFVPFEMFKLLGKKSILDINFGTCSQKEVTVMFLDLRGFTNRCEASNTKDTFAFVNEYLAAITPAIQANKGFVSQFTGDGMLCLFPESADGALFAARDVMYSLSELNKVRVGRGQDLLRIGIGINTCELMVGAIGHDSRMDCTVIGSGVNIAARVEGLTRIYGCDVLLTESTFVKLKDKNIFNLRLVDKVRPKGLQAPIAIYNLMDADKSVNEQDKDEIKAVFGEGLSLYLNKNFSEAKLIFNRIEGLDPVSELYKKRCDSYLINPPPYEWDGVTTFDVK